LTGIAGDDGDESFSETTRESHELSAGGLAPDTEIITTAGPVRVSELSPSDAVYTLDLTTQLAKVKPVTTIERVAYDSDFVALETNRYDLHVYPDHRMVYRTVGQDDLEVRPAHRLEAYEYYKLANDWEALSSE